MAAHGRAFFHPGVHQRADALELHRRDDRTHVDRLIERRATRQLFHARPELRDQPLGDPLVHQQPRAGAAHLPLVEPDRVHHALDHAVEIGVVEHDERTFSRPASSESFLPDPAVALRMMRPTSVEPVNAILSMSDGSRSARPSGRRRSRR